MESGIMMTFLRTMMMLIASLATILFWLVRHAA